ncbi:hypothetical protein HORIV_32510 [Vreelandella olivaria]|uniref:beta-N-acetylhexosaminidase n=1 Tax=Vreelandella olivaria TaxID=390919 RepID=A0ABN5WVF5_9GAMM|nr:hypothetical protein HORIV_32510 [Halomonas olivaria]
MDQEGGRVQRIKEGLTRLPAMARIGECYRTTPEEGLLLAKDAGWLLGMEMAACGLDLSFAPVLDVESGLSSVIGDRSFSSDPQHVAQLGSAFIQGFTMPVWLRWVSISLAMAALRRTPTLHYR